MWSCSLVSAQAHKRNCFSSLKKTCSTFACLQAELEELVKQEHTRIDSQDKSSESQGGPTKASSASVAPQHKKGKE